MGLVPPDHGHVLYNVYCIQIYTIIFKKKPVLKSYKYKLYIIILNIVIKKNYSENHSHR